MKQNIRTRLYYHQALRYMMGDFIIDAQYNDDGTIMENWDVEIIYKGQLKAIFTMKNNRLKLKEFIEDEIIFDENEIF